jgi:hypothetical protein
MPSGIISQAWLERAVLYKLYVYSQEQEGDGLTLTAIKRQFKTEVSSKRVQLALDQLGNEDYIERKSSYGSDPTYSIERKGYVSVEKEAGDPKSFLGHYFYQGDDWLTAHAGLDRVPASDRVVSREDNGDAIARIESDIDKLEAEIRSSNSFDEEVGEPKEVALSEVSASRALLASDRFYLKRLLGLLLPLLQKIVKAFGTASLGVVAKQLIEEIVKLL